ncbi:hypothetical protein AB4865_04175 [Capnocytophaga sp. ARDL2]|uniref:hypothetical protein n=1 Tax=Capnocytophaga sp. ARDL2 TaxID=3238809 RepID=UPI0035587CA2
MKKIQSNGRGYTDFDKKDEQKIKFKANLLADSTFFFAFLLFVFSTLNLVVDWFNFLYDEFDGMFIIITSLIISTLFL